MYLAIPKQAMGFKQNSLSGKKSVQISTNAVTELPKRIL